MQRAGSASRPGLASGRAEACVEDHGVGAIEQGLEALDLQTREGNPEPTLGLGQAQCQPIPVRQSPVPAGAAGLAPAQSRRIALLTRRDRLVPLTMDNLCPASAGPFRASSLTWSLLARRATRRRADLSYHHSPDRPENFPLSFKAPLTTSARFRCNSTGGDSRVPPGLTFSVTFDILSSSAARRRRSAWARSQRGSLT
jgi:hypothetical protein